MLVGPDRLTQIKVGMRRAAPFVVAIAAGIAATAGPAHAETPRDLNPNETTPLLGLDDEVCRFKYKGYSLWFGSEPPQAIKSDQKALREWGINNNQILGPASERVMDVSISRTGQRFTTITTQQDGVGIDQEGRSIISAQAPVEKGVKRFFSGKWWNIALINVYDRVTNTKTLDEVFCSCINNVGFARWMKNPTPTPTMELVPTPTPKPELTPTPTPGKDCPPAYVQIPCTTKQALFNPVEIDPEEVEVGKFEFSNQKVSLVLPRQILTQNLFLEAK